MSAQSPSTSIRLHLLGGASCIGPDGPLKGRIARRNPLAVLAVLAVAGPRGCTRERLVGLFWPDDPEPRARHHLSDTLYIIRRALGDAALVTTPSNVALNRAVVSSDVVDFECAVRDGALDDAAGSYAGPFLDGFHIDRATAFGLWCDGERARLQARCADVLEALAHAAEARDDWATAVSWWQRAVIHDPYNSRCVRALARALTQNGDRGNALCVVREHVEFLEKDLETEPPTEITTLAADAGWDELLAWSPPPPPLRNGGNGALVAPDPAPADVIPDPAACESPLPAGPRMGDGRRRRPWRAMASAAAVCAAAAVFWVGMGGQPNDFTIAVVPFAVEQPDMEMWGEGIANVLAWRLDGAGPLRAVAPREIRASGLRRISRVTVQDMAKKHDARFALYGAVHGNGGDSARVLVWLLDAEEQEVLYEADVHTGAGLLVSAADSIAAGVLTALSESRGLGRVAYRSLGSSNHEAIRAFIRGEWFLRELQLDSAAAHYRKATRLDSTFALAYSHWALAIRHDLYAERRNQDEWVHLQLTAGRLNHGLAPRESLLLVIDSIDGALWTTDRLGLLTMAPFLDRARATINDAQWHYPDDPEVWFRSAEFLMHWTPRVPGTHEEVYEAIARAIALDSTWMHGYAHSLEFLTWAVAGPEEMRRSIDAYRRHLPAGYQQPPREYGLTLVEMLLDGDTTAFWGRVNRFITEADDVAGSAGPLWFAYHAVGWTPDTLEVGLRLARLLGDRLWVLGRLTFHGHMRDARPWFDSVRVWKDPAENFVGLMPDLTLFGAVAPPDSARSIAEQALERDLHPWKLGHGWWGENGDTVVMKRLVERWDSVMVIPAEELAPLMRGHRAYAQHSARGYLALARGDTVAAIDHLSRYIVSPFIYCRYEFVTLGNLYAATGQLRRADDAFRKCASTTPFQAGVGADVYVRLLWARVLEQLGKRREAITNYRFVADAWRNADAELQPYVTEARDALGRIEVGASAP